MKQIFLHIMLKTKNSIISGREKGGKLYKVLLYTYIFLKFVLSII